MVKPWLLIDNGRPVAGLPEPLELGALAYLAFIDAHRSADDDGLTVVPFDESVRRFFHGIQAAGGGHSMMLELLSRGVMEREDVFTWGDVAVERLELLNEY